MKGLNGLNEIVTNWKVIDVRNSMISLIIVNDNQIVIPVLSDAYISIDLAEIYKKFNINSDEDIRRFFSNLNVDLKYILSKFDTKLLLFSKSIFDEINISQDNVDFKNYVNRNNLIKSKLITSVQVRKFFYLLRECFFGIFFEKVEINKDGFLINDLKGIMFTQRRTSILFLNSLMEKDFIRYESVKNNQIKLKFNLNCISDSIDCVPEIFKSAIYQNDSKEIEFFKPINYLLKDIDFSNPNPDIDAINNEVDFVHKQIINQKVGSKSELIAFNYEKSRLSHLGQVELEEKVKIVSENISLGYDILSHELDGRERYIEVKTIKRQDDTSRFYLSRNELDKSRELKNYFIYLVEYFRDSHQVYILESENFMDSKRFKVSPISFEVLINF